jgi:hypothetical protein
MNSPALFKGMNEVSGPAQLPTLIPTLETNKVIRERMEEEEKDQDQQSNYTFRGEI